jgi:ribosomal protein L29
MTGVGRKPLKADDVIDVEATIDTDRFELAMSEMRHEAQTQNEIEQQRVASVRAVAVQVGYQLPVDCADPDLIQRDIAANMRRSVEACLEVGRGLMVLKVACGHGEFVSRLDVLGVERTVAARFMMAAKKFANVATSQHLTKAIGTQSKLLEMLVLDDEQIEELALTGETGELKLDDVATMSVKELRAKVRELKGEVKAKEDVLAKRATQVNELEEKLARVKTVPPDEVLSDLHVEASRQLNDTRGALIGRFSAAVEAIDAHHREHGGDSLAVLAGLIGQLQADLNQLRDAYAIPDVAPELIPEWVNLPEFNAVAEPARG